MIFQENIQFGINLDITSFKNDKRETHNPSGRAHAPVVWDFYQVIITSDWKSEGPSRFSFEI